MALQIHLFGTPRCIQEGQPVAIHRRKIIALLAYLAVTARPQSRDSLATLLWPEYNQSGARANLRRDLSFLKQALDEDILDITRTDVCLSPGSGWHLDTAEFTNHLSQVQTHKHPPGQLCATCWDALTEAVGLYTGDFMDGFTLPDSPEFDEWQFFQREGLRHSLGAALQRLIDWSVNQGAYAQGIEYGRRWLALDPLHEPAHYRLMQLYAWDGKQAAALRQYEECLRLLDGELGVAPGAETVTLYEAIKSRQLTPPQIREESAEPSPVDTISDPLLRYRQGVVSHLPAQPTPFIGREQELAEVTMLLAEPDIRLVTIVGPGGMGKTRLALAAAAASTGSFAHGVYFVPLAPLKSATHIPAALADSFDWHFSGAEEPQQQVLNYLQHKQVLLVLDNLEHLPGSAAFIGDILAAAPAVKILATSRERLNLSSESVYLLAGLSYPRQEEASRTEVTAYNAVQLLLHHARLVRPSLELKPDDLTYAVRICQLVQGLPLALVLAAGWFELLSLEEVVAEITQSLDFLETTLSDVPARQRSMRAVFESSWKRLTLEEQQIFARLTVFRGGFTRQAARAVAGNSLRSLRVLVNKSFVSANENGRFDIHEVLRQYAEEHLPAYASEEDLHTAHSIYYLDLLHRLEENVKGRRQLEALNEIDSDFENIRAAWEWALQCNDEAIINRAAESLHLFSDMRHRQQDGAALFLQARDRLAPIPGQPPSTTWGRILTRGAFLRLIITTTHWTDIEADLEQALAIARRDDDSAEIGLVCMTLGAFIILTQADSARAAPLLEQSRACYEALGDLFYLSRALGWLAYCHFDVSGIEKYHELLSQELELARQAGSRVDVAFTLMNMADAVIGLGAYLAAERYIQEATPIAGGIGARGIMAYGKVLHAFVSFLLHGDSEQSRTLLQEGWKVAADVNYGAAIAYALAINSIINSIGSGKYAEARHQARESLAMPHNNGLGIILARWGLTIADYGLGNYEAAWRALQATIQHVRDFKSLAVLTWTLPVAALLLARQEQKERAIEFLALATSHPLSPTSWQAQWLLLDEMAVSLEQELGQDTFQAAWQRGTVLDLEQAIESITDPAA